MKLNNRITLFIVTLLFFIGIYLFCTDPQKPDFGDPPVIGNNKQILADRPPVLNDTLILCLTLETGAEPLTYQWYKNDTVISRASSDSLKFEPLKLSDTGTYHCVVTNILGSDVSKPFKLDSINEVPVIGNNKQVIPSGTPKKDSSFFMYITATGTKPLSYQWFKDSTPVITGGATNDTLKFSALKYSDTGDYYCVALNYFGSDTSKPHNLSLTNQTPKWSVDTMRITATETQLCTLNVKDSCSDPDGDSLTFRLVVGAPAGDTILGTYYRFTAGYTDAGSYVATVQASDGKKTSDCYIKLSVLNKNRAPYFLDTLPKTLYTVPEGSKLVINFKAVDPDGDSIFYKLTKNTLPDNGPVVFTNSKFEWQSTYNDSGMYSVEISADDKSDTTKAPVSVAVGNVNIPPQIKIGSYKQGDTLRVKESDTLTFTVTATDPDAGDIPVLLSPKNKPAGSTYDTSSGYFTYTPSFSISTGLVNTLFLNVRFYATDKKPQYSTDSFYIHLQVLDSNSAPKWTVNSADLAATEGKTLSYNINAVFSGDDEGDKITFTKTFGTFNADTSQWLWTPSFTSFHGKDTICVLTATDNHNPPASSSLGLTVSIADSVVPVILSKPSNITYKSMKITWTQSAEPQFGAYKIYYDVSSNVTETSNLAATITDIYKTTDTLDDLNENTRYYARVFTYNTNNTKSGSNIVDSTTLILNPPTLTVTSVTITNDSCAIKQPVSLISGTALSDAGIASVTAKINDAAVVVTGTASWSFSIATATIKAWNKIEITATDTKGKTTTKTFQMFYKPALATPAAPTISNITNRSMTVSWSQITYCDKYAVYRSTANSGPYIIVKDTTSTSIKDTMLDINTQYWYEIRGYYSVAGNMRDSTVFSPYGNGMTKNWFRRLFNCEGSWTYTPDIIQVADSGYLILGDANVNTNPDILLLKINKSGDSLWSKHIGGNDTEGPSSINKTADGGSIICGTTTKQGSVQQNLFIIKLDIAGNLEWQKSPVHPAHIDHNVGYFAQQTYDGGYIIFSLASLDTGGYVTFIKTNSSGEYSWSKSFVADYASDYGWSGFQTLDSGYIFATKGNTGTWLAKINSKGDSLWIKTIDGKWAYAAIPCADGSLVFGGGVMGSTKAMLYKAYPDGTLFWDKDYYGNDGSVTYCVQNLQNGGFILTGLYSTSNSTFLIKTDASGNVGSSNTFNKIFNDGTTSFGNSVQLTFDGGYAIAVSKTIALKNYVEIIKTDENGNIGD